MPDDQKLALFNILNVTSLATNGLSMDGKIQKMTEALFYLGINQINQSLSLNDNIKKLLTEKCSSCKALKHTYEYEQIKRDEKIIEKYKKEHNIKDDTVKEVCIKDSDDKETNKIPKTTKEWIYLILTKPWIYITLAISMISPYGIQVIKALLALLPLA